MGRLSKLSDEDKNLICNMYKTRQYNIIDLANQFNVHPATIRSSIKDIRKQMGIKKWVHITKTQKGRRIELYNQIRDLYKTRQYTYAELGQKFNLSRERIRQIVTDLRKEMGLGSHTRLKKTNINTEAALKRKALTVKKHAKIKDYYLKTKKPLDEIAKKFHRSREHVYVIVKDVYEKANRKKKAEMLHDFIRQLYITGEYSYKELAVKTGMSVPTMYNICRGICTDKLAKIRKAVKCIETGKVFKSVKDASIYYNVNKAYMSAYLNNRSLSKGYKIKSVKGLHFEYVK